MTPRDMDPKLYDKTLEEVRTRAQQYLDAKADAVRNEGGNVSTQLVDGSVPFTLMWAVDSDDILVITSRGRGGYKRWSLGSVAEKLIREAPCPVLLQRGPEDAAD